MSKTGIFCAVLSALLVSACAEAPTTEHRPAMRFDTAPMEFSRNPKMTTKLVHTFTSNENELLDVADRIEAETRKTQDAIAAVEAAEAAEQAPTPLPESDLIY